MTGCSVPLILAVLTLGGVGLVAAQIPTVCANNDDLQSGRCCPNNCSESDDRGTCTQVSKMCKTDYDSSGLPENFTSDGRFNWPSQIFTQVCNCSDNYGGYDCSECKFGYEGDDCTETKQVTRTSITADDFEWTKYRNQLNRAKTAPYTRYKVYTGGNVKDEMSYKPVTLYNLFAWMHHYVARTAQDTYKDIDDSAYDYAHESVGFLTWHRIYLLWFEREMQILLGDDFTVRYWDWTKQQDALFTPEKLGAYDDDGEVTGELMTDWYIVCADTDGSAKKDEVCDPTPVNRHVFRCGTVGNCTYRGWPDEENVRRGLKDFANYRTNTNANSKIINKYDDMSFSNYIEGFANDDNDECINMLEGKERDLICGEEEPFIRRRLHNLIHVLLGGTMKSPPIAANDPVFINHHTMIDCLFEQWLENHPNRESQYPPTLDPKFAGHAPGDCMVPFIPVYTHSEVFSKSASHYGYSCGLRQFLATDSNNPHTTDPCTKTHCTGNKPDDSGNQSGNSGGVADSSLASATMLVSMVVLCLVAIAL